MTSSQYANHTYFRQNQSFRVKQKNKEESRTQTGVSVVNASLWLLPKKACAVRTLTKFLKNYLKGKNALQNQVGSEWFAWKNQYYILYYQPLIIYVVIIWKIWTIVNIDLQDISNILFGCIIILGQVFAKSFNHIMYGKYKMSARQIMTPMHFLQQVKKMKSTVWILTTKIFFTE